MIPNKTEKSGLYAMVALGYILVICFTIHYSRLWSLVQNGTVARDAVALEMGLSKSTSSNNYIAIGIAALQEMLLHPFTLQGFSLSLFLIAWLIFTGIFAYFLWYQHLRMNVVGQTIAPEKSAGSSKFMSQKDIKQYNETMTDPYTEEDEKAGKIDTNIIIADKLKLSMNGRKVRRNINVLVVGGSGTGKTYGIIKPNVMQMNCSFIVTDPSGEIMEATGRALLEHGYTLKLFSTSDMAHSNVYNPFDYIYTEDGKLDETKVKVMVETFMKNVDQSKKGGGDPFWDKAATSYLTFGIYFLCEFFSEESRNMAALLTLTQLGKTDESSSSSKTALDKMVEAKMAINPKAKCFTSYRTFKLAPAKTANSILITLGVNLEPFGSADKVKNMTSTAYVVKSRDENGKILELERDADGHPIRTSENLDLDTLGDEKTALFVNIPQANGAYNFLVSMMYSQFFDAMYTKAEKICPNRFNLFDSSGIALSSQYVSKEEAEHYRELYANAEVKTFHDPDTDTDKYYIFNKHAGAVSKDFVTAKEAEQYSAARATAVVKELTPKDSETGKPVFFLADKDGNAVSKMLFPSRQAAEIYQRKFQLSVSVESYTDNTGTEKFFVYSPMLAKKYTLPDKAFNKKTIGCLKEVYTKEVGYDLIKKYKTATVKHGYLGLPVPVRCLLDEFANIGEIPDFNAKLSTMRKYGLSCTIILQSLSQIKEKYEKLWESMVGNCDTIIFLGSSENETDKYISERLGKATIRIMSTSESKGNTGSSSSSWSYKDRSLLDPAELSKMSNDDCIVLIRGFQPFYMKKYDYTKHPHYPETGDADDSRMIKMDYLEEHFKCSDKELMKAGVTEAQSQKDKNLEQHNVNPNGVDQTTATPEKPIDDADDVSGIMGAANPKDGADKMRDPNREDLKGTDAPDIKQQRGETTETASENNSAEPPTDDTEPPVDVGGETADGTDNTNFGDDTTGGAELGQANDDNAWFFAN
jgi:type IV secretory pathway TraG/TraD family ATPase VirD4